MFSGERLKQAREWSKLSREALSAKLETSSSIVYKWEAENVIPSANVIARMAQILQVTADWLLMLVDEPSAAISENDLSDQEQELLSALRRGDGGTAVKKFSELFNQGDKDPNIVD